jgi:hypothetical protein
MRRLGAYVTALVLTARQADAAALPDVYAFTTGGNAAATYTTPTVAANSDAWASGTVACLPPSGGNFNVGSTTVTCTANDVSGNPATKTFE